MRKILGTVVGVMMLGLGLGACTTAAPAAPAGPAAGCYHVTPAGGALDVYYSGTASTFGNAHLFLSTDGTCTGGTGYYATVVVGADSPAAIAKCASVNGAFTGAESGTLYGLPATAWFCTPLI